MSAAGRLGGAAVLAAVHRAAAAPAADGRIDMKNASIVDNYFSKADFDAMEAAVKKAELTTSGEIAVELASRSKNWMTERLMHSFAFTLLCMLSGIYFTREDNWGVYYNTTQAILWGAIGFAAAYFGWGQFLKRRERRRKAVWDRAVEQFLKLTPVRGLAGVLIFVSLEEQEAAIVADTGIASKVSPDYWLALHTTIIGAIKQGNHSEGIIQTIEIVAAELAKHFPRQGDDVNEQSDRPKSID
jgi:putative membrane protein